MKKKSKTFSELMTALDIDTGKMSFHLRNLKQFLDQTPKGEYKLNRLGQHALRLIKDVEALSVDVDFFGKTNWSACCKILAKSNGISV